MISQNRLALLDWPSVTFLHQRVSVWGVFWTGRQCVFNPLAAAFNRFDLTFPSRQKSTAVQARNPQWKRNLLFSWAFFRSKTMTRNKRGSFIYLFNFFFIYLFIKVKYNKPSFLWLLLLWASHLFSSFGPLVESWKLLMGYKENGNIALNVMCFLMGTLLSWSLSGAVARAKCYTWMRIWGKHFKRCTTLVNEKL